MPAKKSQLSVPHHRLEYSTQLMMRAAKKRGLEVEILDWAANCITVTKGARKEFLFQASKTALDSYSTILIMKSKSLTKILLAQTGLAFPRGQVFDNENAAIRAVNALFKSRLAKDEETTEATNEKKWQGLVIKPDSTNYGTGVLICHLDHQDVNHLDSVYAHISNCLSLSPQVIIEEWIPGKEYRFLIVGKKCVAVCYRIPANVIGDGQSTIEQLIEQTNQDPRRGTHHRKPLQKIEIEAILLNHLQAQGLSLQATPKKQDRVFLRENSNISTGGESIDVTANMPASLKKLAQQAARAVNSRLCGVDMILRKDPDEPDEPDDTMTHTHSKPIQEKEAIILEINHNPCLFIHEAPAIGAGQEVCDHILRELGF